VSSRSIKAAAATLAALLILAAVPLATAAQRPPRVTVVLAPYLTWDDVLTGPMTATRRIAEAGLVADANVRSGAVGGGPASLTRGALTVSAGDSSFSDVNAYAAYSTSEPVGGFTASDLYRRVFGRSPGAADVLFPGQPQQATANLQDNLGAVLGSLGGAVRSTGGITAAIGNSDPGMDAVDALRSRPAGIVAADRSGRVLLGDVSTGLLTEDRTAPYGVRTDLSRFEAAYRGVLSAGESGLIVLDPGDLARAYAFASAATAPAAEAARAEALKATDRVVAMVEKMDPDGVLIVLAPVVPEAPDEPPAYAPLIVRGGSRAGALAGAAGIADAPSTRREGIVTVMDVAATIVAENGAVRPSSMIGSTIVQAQAMKGAGLAERIGLLQQLNATAIATETYRMDTVNTFITLTVIALFVAALLLYRGAEDIPARVCSFTRGLLVFLACVPLAGVLEFAVWRYPSSPGAVLGLMLAVAVVVWAVAMWLGRGRPAAVPMIVVTGLTTIVLLVDQWVGAPLSYANTFGYSGLFGARYYGIGNEMAALLLGSAMVCAALALDTWPDAAWARPLRRWGWPVIGAIVLGTAAAPFLGANIGTVAWMTVGYLFGWLVLNGRRVWTWRNVAIIVALIVVIVVVFGAIDLLRGPGSETHLGRLISDARGTGGLAALWTIIARKADTNLRVLGRTNWTWLLLAILLLLGYMRWRPRGEFAMMLRSYPAYAAALGAALFAGVAGYFTEDSGIIIPALILLPVGVSAMHLMMSRSGWQGGERS